MMKCAAIGLALWAAAVHAQGVRVEADEPRAFGYRIGDTVERRVTVHAGAGWQLDTDSLPKPGARGGALELRRVATTAHAEGDGWRHELHLQYQVFVSPPAVRTFEIAPFRLRFDSAQRSEDVRVEAWPVTVAPLAPLEASPRRGLGELRPDHPPPLIDDRALRLRLQVCAAVAGALLIALSVIQLGTRWRAARNRPFGRAWRQLRRLSGDTSGAAWRSACKTVHDALNRSAGEVVFESGLERFVAARPAFAALRDDLARFLHVSRDEFFAGSERAGGDVAWLTALCRRCHDAERGFAPRRAERGITVAHADRAP
jgi:mxaA protein